jgi:YNFM family putative membrane transporter
MIRAVIASGIYISGNTIGGVSTRILSAILEQHIGWRFTLELLAATSLVLAISFVAITHNITDDKSGSDSESTKGLINELWQSRVLLVFLQGFVTLGTFNALFSLLPFRIHDTAPHFATVLTTMVLGLYVLAFIPSQLGGRIAGRIGIHRVLAIGYSLAFVGLALLFADGIAALIAGVSAFIIGAFFVHPLSSAESGRRAPKHRAQSTALYQIGWLTGATLISPLATTIYDVAGWTASVALLIATLFCGALGAIAGRRFEGI